jgi:hypothetical protein
MDWGEQARCIDELVHEHFESTMAHPRDKPHSQQRFRLTHFSAHTDRASTIACRRPRPALYLPCNTLSLRRSTSLVLDA